MHVASCKAGDLEVDGLLVGSDGDFVDLGDHAGPRLGIGWSFLTGELGVNVRDGVAHEASGLEPLE